MIKEKHILVICNVLYESSSNLSFVQKGKPADIIIERSLGWNLVMMVTIIHLPKDPNPSGGNSQLANSYTLICTVKSTAITVAVYYW